MPLRQRKEIQKMSRRLSPLIVVALLFPLCAAAAIWPETLGPFHRTADQPVNPTADQAIWDEYGLREAETAQYQNDSQKFTATAWRLQDPTGALGAFEWLRPADSKPSALAKLAAETPTSCILVHANYLLRFEGYRPDSALVTTVAESLTKLDNSSLPIDYLPSQDLVPNSERYIEGPAALAKFDPGIPPSTAAFHLSAEAHLATYRAASSGPPADMKLAIFSYPTPQIARQQTAQLQQIAGATVKRSGPVVAVILAAPNADAAERLLSLVRYQADITLDERVSTRRDNIGNLVINAFVLIGILLCFALVGGLAFGSFRAFLRRGGRGDAADAMITLHLQDR